MGEIANEFEYKRSVGLVESFFGQLDNWKKELKEEHDLTDDEVDNITSPLIGFYMGIQEEIKEYEIKTGK